MTQDLSYHVRNQLTRDDHPQYMKADGTRAFSGPVTVPSLTSTGAVTSSGFVDSTDVLVGGLVVFATGPGSNTNYSTVTTIFTQAVSLVAGHKYEVTISVYAQQITNANVNASVYCTDSAGLIIGGNGGIMRAAGGDVAANEIITGCNSTIITAASTGTDTFTVTANSSAASLTVFANSAQLTVKRVA